MILNKIVEATKIRIEKKKRERSLNDIKELALKVKNNQISFKDFLNKKDIAFICEVKKASPSKGIISDNFDYIQISKQYEEAGANAISVLTEPDFFKGSIEYLKAIRKEVNIPILQKDFIIDQYQIYEAKLIGANAILLICSILNIETIRKYISIADSLGLDCLVEAHNEEEINMALSSGARIIGVNNRNLKTFDIDINNSINLRKLVPKDILFVSESGIKTSNDINNLRKNGVNAVLIGETLMKSNDKKKELNLLRGKINE